MVFWKLSQFLGSLLERPQKANLNLFVSMADCKDVESSPLL